MTFFQTLRFKLTIIYLLTIVAPFIVLALAMPYYSEGILKNETQKLTAGTLNALTRNLHTYMDDLERLTASPYLNDNVIQALKYKAGGHYRTASAYDKLQTDRALTGTLPNYLINTREDILSTIIISTDGQAYLTSKHNAMELVPNFPFSSQDWYKQAVDSDGRVAFISSHPQSYLINQGSRQVFSVARLIKDPDSRRPLAVILADADTKVLEKITRDITFNVSSIVVILDQNRNVIYANKPLTAALQAQLTNGDHPVSDRTAYVTVSRTLTPADWEIVVLLSNNEIKSKVRWTYIVAVLLSVGGLFVTFFVFLYFTRWIVNPFRQMNTVMNQVKKGNLDTRYVPEGSDEIARLGESFNSMIAQLNELINKEYKAVLAQRDAEYRALQSQIQPHFLYNTLNCFIGLNRAGDTKQLENAIFSLSGMLRYILQENQWATIENEFLFLQKYGMLQQTRFQERLTIHVSYDTEAADFPIPKLLVQPLVENAIIHGVEPDDKANLVTVHATTRRVGEQSFVVIEISDNGLGFDARGAAGPRHSGAEAAAALPQADGCPAVGQPRSGGGTAAGQPRASSAAATAVPQADGCPAVGQPRSGGGTSAGQPRASSEATAAAPRTVVHAAAVQPPSPGDMRKEPSQSDGRARHVPRPHTGLPNVEARLKLAYPDAVMHIASTMGAGTRVTITIPKGEEQHERVIG
ncbi:sensor histidine kinase [Paenibacillus xerothermodurans]|uniref:HAMP domain-containing protein n=1 Tax=Paenibacillus xerothermodurans TaxID=1977292 RepID=A0A2W1NYG2_PAEXE|nr:sensor histidine kinase [Paenibacillus xerothermodurans]PZE20562.1 HAMP domain-containing protein [Paenibacillus xerothermodurans]